MNLSEFLYKDSQKPLMRLATAGSVDDGKSTLIGRLLHDTKNVFTDQLASIQKSSRLASGVDFSLLTDGLRAEREQGITIDVAYRYFSTPLKKYILSDTPGHEQYTRNMVTGASNANVAIVLVDARKGVLTQTKRHTFIASLLGIKRICVAVNKMDLVDYSEEVFKRIVADYRAFIANLGLTHVEFFPISALNGDNVVTTSLRTPWNSGPSLMQYLDRLELTEGSDLPLRFPVQLVTRTSDFRGYAGQIVSGAVKVGDEISVLPSGQSSKVKSIVTFDGPLDEASAGRSVTVELFDELDVGRGDMIVSPKTPASTHKNFEAMTVWMSETPMNPDVNYQIQFSAQTVKANLKKPQYAVDVNSLSHHAADTLRINEIGMVGFHCHKQPCWDPYSHNRHTGSFVIIDPATKVTVGAGMIVDRSLGMPKPFTTEERAEKFHQKGCVVWMTGLSGAGKSTISLKLERELFARGNFCFRLDGDDLRSGLNQDLGFSPTDRKENIRRTAEIGRLLAENGIIAIAALISPLESDREMARQIVGKSRFFEIFIQTSLEECQRRDPKGLYKKAKAGKILEFTGISSPYEVPVQPDLIINSEKVDVEEAAKSILEMLRQREIT